MAVFQAARARPSSGSARDARIAVLGSRTATRAFVRPRLIAEATIAVPRIRPAAMLVGVVLVAAMLGFAYLTQTLTSTTTAVAIEQLVAEQQHLQQVIAARVAIINAESAASYVQDRAIALGLSDNGRPIVPSSR